MKIQDVTPEYVKEMRSLGFQPNAEEIVGMKIQDVTPEYVKALAAEGYKLDAHQVSARRSWALRRSSFRRQRVTALRI